MTALRNPSLGAIESLPGQFDRDWSLEMFRRLVTCRAFDARARQAQIDGALRTLIYLSYGQEAVATGISMAMQGSWVLGQHRAHAMYLTFGGRPRELADELLGLPTGSNAGMGGSPPIQDIERRIIGHNGLIGDQVPVACGVALRVMRKGEKVVCFFGDGAAEEDYVLAALGFAASKKLPILFVCEDNDLSVLTPTRDRRTWETSEVARSFGLASADISDDPWLVAHWADRMSTQLPALLNVRTARNVWHVGTGTDGPPEWNRYELVVQTLRELQLGSEVERIEREVGEEIGTLWDERLRIQSAS